MCVVAPWLVRSSQDRAVRVRALAGGTLCCVLGQDTLLSQCLPPPRSINGYRRIVGENLTNCWGVTCDGLASRPEGVEILLAASCYGNQDKLWPDESVLAPKASLIFNARVAHGGCMPNPGSKSIPKACPTHNPATSPTHHTQPPQSKHASLRARSSVEVI